MTAAADRQGARAPGGTALFAGGGSAGHDFPARAVAEELAGRGWGVRFAGTAGRIEERLVGERGWPFAALPAQPLVGRNPLAQLRALAVVGGSTLAARRLLRRHRVDVAVGTGGYVSAPAILGARLAGLPSLLVEPNAGAGVANRYLSRWASAAAVAYAATGDRLYCPAFETGVPVRREFFEAGEAAAEAAGSGAAPRLLVLGGSQGARQLNRSLPGALAALAGRFPGLAVVHQAGRGKVAETEAAYAEAGLPPGSPEACGWTEIRVVDFLPEVARAMAAADLVVSRAGAITTAEICAAGRAALLVPLALAGGHQMDNARHLADAGAAVLVASDELDTGGPERLAVSLAGLLADPERLAAMGRAARRLARPGAAAAIADRVEALAGRPAAAETAAAAGGAGR
jgi:UDP-N-acetylglucosamine--N-acetylmuramyl-(pentapeptide) pyrophosphoryl-undecaprenol N-acetylglucosamine transferase